MRGTQKRKRPSSRRKSELLEIQKGRCFYCGSKLQEFVVQNGKTVFLDVHWDHLLAFSYSFNNHDCNFVATCGTCNLLKSSKVFDTVQEALNYVLKKRTKRRLPVYAVRRQFPAEAKLAEVLQPQVPDGQLLEAPPGRRNNPGRYSRACCFCGRMSWFSTKSEMNSRKYCSVECSRDDWSFRRIVRWVFGTTRPTSKPAYYTQYLASLRIQRFIDSRFSGEF